MALDKQVFLVLLVIVSLASATRYKNPPPSFNGCYRGRNDETINAQAVFDMGGVTGYVQFYQRMGQPAQINVNLEGLHQFGEFYPWHAHEFPVRDALLKDFPCSDREVGGHYDPTGAFTTEEEYAANCNQMNQTLCEVGDFSGKLGFLRNDQSQQYFEDENLDLFGPLSVIGRSLVIHYPGEPQDRWICANIEPAGCRVKNLRAEFDNGIIEGEVVIRYTEGQDIAKIYVDLFQNGEPFDDREKDWTLHFGPADSTCGRSEIAGDSSLHDFPSCSSTQHRKCPFGDLSTKCGRLQLTSRRMRLCCTDTQIGVIPFDTLWAPNLNHYLYLMITDVESGEIDGCARFNKVIPQVAKAKFESKDLIGTVMFYQASPLDRTFIQPTIESIRGRDITLLIRENPVIGEKNQLNKNCTAAALGNILRKEPGRAPIFGRPLQSLGATKTGDARLLGNLGSAIPIPPGTQRHTRRSSSHYLPLTGPHSIVGHSLVVVENVPDVGPVPLACGTIRLASDRPEVMFASFTGYHNFD